MVSRISIFNRNKSSRSVPFRKEGKKRTLLGLFRSKQVSSSKANKDQLPSNSQTVTWTLSLESDNSQTSESYNDMHYGIGHKVLMTSSPLQEAMDSMERRHARELEALQEQLSFAQQTLSEVTKNEQKYLGLCDEFETIACEQEQEIAEKDSVIRYQSRLLGMFASRNADATEQIKRLENAVSDLLQRGEQHVVEYREKKLEIFERDLEIKFQQEMNETIILQTKEHQRDIREQEAIRKLKDDLVAMEIERLKSEVNKDNRTA
eukprot:scaffold16511_cov92-Cylindrotheca_fusiformis.AAC.1